MGLFQKRNRKINLCLYSEKDQCAYEKMISDNLGAYKGVFHEIVSDGLHIDIIILSPSASRDYYTLVTMGQGAYKMPVPSDYGKMNRAEIAIRLPKDWNIKSDDEKWYWPIRMLKQLARLPYNEQSWLGLYHDIDFGEPFSEETKLCGVVLDVFDENMKPLTLENGDQLILYNAIPIFRTEMEYIMTEGAAALLEKMSSDIIHGPIDIHRKSVI